MYYSFLQILLLTLNMVVYPLIRRQFRFRPLYSGGRLVVKINVSYGRQPLFYHKRKIQIPFMKTTTPLYFSSKLC